MKRFYTTVVLLGALVTGAYAQKNLKIALVKPTASQVFTNTPDSIYYEFAITNNGPDTVNAAKGDTLHVMIDIQYFGCVLQNIKWLEEKIAANILPGQTITLNLTTVVGGEFWSTSTAPKVSVTPDSKWCPKVGVFGVTTTGTGSVFFAGNPGVNVTTINNASTNATTQAQFGDMVMPGLSGDNLGTVTGVTFGSGAANKCSTTDIIDFTGDAKTGLNIYPNPAATEVRMKYTFANENATARVTDITGRVLLTKDYGKQPLGEKELSLDISSLQNGIYYIELVTDTHRAINKLTVRK
jgi:hypothetical protein